MKTPPKANQNTFPKLFQVEGPDTVNAWAGAYLRLEVTTSERSRQEQRRDLQRFLDFLFQVAGSDARLQWTPRLSRVFVDALCQERYGERRRWSDRTINRIVAHVKTFAKWLHKHRPFPLGNPMERIKALPLSGRLEIECALTEAERRGR